MDFSPPGFSVHGILQARTLEWVALSLSNAWKWKVKVKSLSHVPVLATPWTAAYQAPPSMGLSGQQYWSGVPLPSPENAAGSCKLTRNTQFGDGMIGYLINSLINYFQWFHLTVFAKWHLVKCWVLKWVRLTSLSTRRSLFQICTPLLEILTCSPRQVHKNFRVKGRQ